MPALLGKGLGSKFQRFDILCDALDHRTKLNIPVYLKIFLKEKVYRSGSVWSSAFQKKLECLYIEDNSGEGSDQKIWRLMRGGRQGSVNKKLIGGCSD